MVVNHLDAYRIEQFGDAEDLAIPELLEDGVTLVEWGNNILPALPADRLEVRILLADDDDERRIEFVAIGERWSSRLAELARRLVPWGDMLILGIESATSRVGCAIGGHEGTIASAHSSRVVVTLSRWRRRSSSSPSRPAFSSPTSARSRSTSGLVSSPVCASASPLLWRWPPHCGFR